MFNVWAFAVVIGLSFACSSSKGAPGPQGAAGAQGTMGQSGPQGTTGPPGPAGAILSVYDANDVKLGTLISVVNFGSLITQVLWMDSGGAIWWSGDLESPDMFSSTPWYASSDCSGTGYAPSGPNFLTLNNQMRVVTGSGGGSPPRKLAKIVGPITSIVPMSCGLPGACSPTGCIGVPGAPQPSIAMEVVGDPPAAPPLPFSIK
jgi:hypothetical protein